MARLCEVLLGSIRKIALFYSVIAALLFLPVLGFESVRQAYWNELAIRSAVFVKPSVVMFGDSITHNGTPWGFRLHRNPLSVVSIAGSGLTAFQLKYKMENATQLHSKNIVITVGTNDIWGRNYDRSRTISDILYLVESAKKSRANVVVTLVPPPMDPQKARIAFDLKKEIAPLLKKRGVITIDLWPDIAPEGTLMPEFTTDGIHFSSAAYAIWAQKLRPVLS